MAKGTTDQSIPESAQLIGELAGVLGFDVTKGIQPDKDVFAEVIKELNEERRETQKAQAKALAAEATKSAEDFGKLKKAFLAQEAKFVKEFKKTMNKVRALAAGQEAPADDEEGTEK